MCRRGAVRSIAPEHKSKTSQERYKAHRQQGDGQR